MRYEVKWCVSIPTDENGDAIHDSAVFEVRSFPSRQLAEDFAARTLLVDAYGVVRMNLVIPSQRPDFDQDDWDGWRDGRGRWWEITSRWLLDDTGWNET